MKIINLTPHDVNIYTEKGVKTIKSSGAAARCAQSHTLIGCEDGICFYKTAFGAVENLPEPRRGVFYIVSNIVAQAVKNQRSDVLIPFDPVRDKDGSIIGCRGLARL